MQPIKTQDLIQQHLEILRKLEYKSGLFAASKKDSTTGYDKAWLRDNFYTCLAFEFSGDWQTVKQVYRAILDIFIKHEYKIDAALEEKPKHGYEYLHPRYHPETFDEFWEDWGFKQHDSIGAILFKIGELEAKGTKILETKDDKRVIQKLVQYLDKIMYWADPDNGIWEEDEELHASSIGACLAGLKMIKKYTDVDVSQELIEKGEKILHHLLPRESKRKFVDLALLSLIFPYNVVTPKERDEILQHVEYHLLRGHGLIRYKNDHYYNKNPDGYSEEAEWCFGFSWLAIIYSILGNEKYYEYYLQKAKETINPEGDIPELYYSNTDKYNENSPLGWAESLFIVALYHLNKKSIAEVLPDYAQMRLKSYVGS
ncbi:glycoside hydrolase family 15 protein [Nanoarchaeota archaeon]